MMRAQFLSVRNKLVIDPLGFDAETQRFDEETQTG